MLQALSLLSLLKEQDKKLIILREVFFSTVKNTTDCADGVSRV
jgi:hypothetical protein